MLVLIRVHFWFVCSFGACARFGSYNFFYSCAFGSCVCRDRGSCAVLIHTLILFMEIWFARGLVCVVFCLCAHLARVLCVCILLVYAFWFVHSFVCLVPGFGKFAYFTGVPIRLVRVRCVLC